MSLDRRDFLAGCSAGCLALGVNHMPAAATNDDAPAKVRAKGDIPTPGLIVDLDALEANLKTMADHCRRAGVQFRPHAKTHKCPALARRQIEAGAVGVCAATVPEAEALAAAGIPGVLLTSPIVEA